MLSKLFLTLVLGGLIFDASVGVRAIRFAPPLPIAAGEVEGNEINKASH